MVGALTSRLNRLGRFRSKIVSSGFHFAFRRSLCVCQMVNSQYWMVQVDIRLTYGALCTLSGLFGWVNAARECLSNLLVELRSLRCQRWRIHMTIRLTFSAVSFTLSVRDFWLRAEELNGRIALENGTRVPKNRTTDMIENVVVRLCKKWFEVVLVTPLESACSVVMCWDQNHHYPTKLKVYIEWKFSHDGCDIIV